RLKGAYQLGIQAAHKFAAHNARGQPLGYLAPVLRTWQGLASSPGNDPHYVLDGTEKLRRLIQCAEIFVGEKFALPEVFQARAQIARRLSSLSSDSMPDAQVAGDEIHVVD